MKFNVENRLYRNIGQTTDRYSCWNIDSWDIWASKSIAARRVGAVGGAIKRNFDERRPMAKIILL